MATTSGPALKTLTLAEQQSTLASAFFSAMLAAGVTQYAVKDTGAAGGYFLLAGKKLAYGVLTTLTAAQLATLQYVAGTSAGVDTLTFETYANGAWSAASTTTATTVAPPTLTGKNATLDEGQSIAASTLIGSIVNPAGASTTQYAFTEKGSDGGELLLNGSALTAGKVYDLTAAQLAQLTYVAGSAAGTDSVSIQSYDGTAWSAAATVTLTVAAPPSVTLNKPAIVAGQTITGASLIAGTTDAAGDAITEYAVMNTGADGGAFYLNGKALADGVWTTLTAAQLAQLTYVGGSGAGTDSISFKVFDGHVWSSVATATITQTAPSILSQLGNAGVEADVAKLMVNNALSYNAMLTILDDAEVGGMTASKFSTLQTLAGLLNKINGISTSAYVQQIARDVIDGNSANAVWNGGSSTTTALGNLSATSTQTQTTELVGEWFLGTDLPSTNVSSIGESNLASTYKLSTSPLYGASGAPSYLDVNQGYDGDCYFMSSIAEVALQDPSAIESMITNNGNGTYGVRFLINGQDDYVTVNADLANMPAGYDWANNSTLEFANGSALWPELIEKAYAQLNAQTNVTHGAQLNAASDSYAGIDSGGAYAITEITGQSVTGFNLSTSTSATTLTSDFSQLAAAFSGKEELLVGTSGGVTGNLVADHMFQVIGYTAGTSAATDMLTLHNPWGSAYSGSLPMTFTESLAALAANDCSVYMSVGKVLT